MQTSDRITMDATPEACFAAAADVERWPTLLPHYRWVRFLSREGPNSGRVEMAARRSFGPLPYPVWWVSEMWTEEEPRTVRYRHVAGITRGMEVTWSFEALGTTATAVEIIHEWESGPAWPLPAALRRWIARAVIGPFFVHFIASRTLEGIRTEVERRHADRSRAIR